MEDQISKLTASKNAKILKDQVGQFLLSDGTFSQTGMWRLKAKVLPRKRDPPMAKLDEKGNLITGQVALKNLYSRTYVDRLRPRPMKEGFEEVYQLKTLLWAERFKCIKQKQSKQWTFADLEKVLKTLKTIKKKDPLGMVNELLKPGVMGQDLRIYEIGQYFFNL